MGADRTPPAVVLTCAAVSITVVGSIAFDAVQTPFGERERMLGGAATYFSLAASMFDTVNLVGPVGDDFGDAEMAVLRTRGANVEDVEHVAGGRSFFWRGRYHDDMNSRDTLDTQLGVFEHFDPKLSANSRAAETLFLANIQPGLQLQVREQCDRAGFVALDSGERAPSLSHRERERRAAPTGEGEGGWRAAR